MTDLASLGLAIDSSPAEKAAAALDKLATSAKGAGQAADSLSTTAAKGAASVQATATAAEKAAVGLAGHTAAMNDNQKAAGLNFLQFEVLRSSVERFSDAVIAGQSPLHAFVQQASGATAAIGEDGLSGLAKRAAVSIGGLASSAAAGVSAIGATGLAIGGVTAAVLVAVAAQQSYAATQAALAQNLAGVGKASGATAGQINAVASTFASAGNISVRSARDIAGQFAATGKIGVDMYAGLAGTVKDFAATTGQDLPDATKELATAFADPAKGADTLNAQLGFLNATTRENIIQLEAQGDRLGAQQALLAAYRTGLTSATELTTGWGRATADIGRVISNAWDAAGQAINRVTTGGDLETRLATAKKVLANSQSFSAYLPASIADVSGSQAEVNRLQAEVDRRAQQSKTAQTARASIEINGTVQSLNPQIQQQKSLEDSVTKIRNGLADLPLDEQGRARQTMLGLVAQANQLRQDMKSGGAEFADGVRNAQYGLATSGFSPTAKSLADVNKQASDRQLAVNRSDLNPIDRAAQLAAIEQQRAAEEQRVRLDATRTNNTAGGAFSQFPASLQQQILDASRQTGISETLIAAIGSKENGGRLTGGTTALGENGRPSSAYGFGQITTGAEKDIQQRIPGFDRTDPSQAVLGTATYLQILKERAGGNEDAAIQNYYGSSSQTKNLSYLADVRRRQGQSGDASDAGTARDVDANTRALTAQQAQIENATQNYGKNGIALDATNRANQQLQDLQTRGVTVTNDLKNGVLTFSNQAATAAQSLKLVQFANDNSFARDQLGRTQPEQAAFSQARSVVGDTTSPQAQMVIEQTKLNDALKQTKDLSSSAFTGFATDLAHGATAASALTGVLTKVEDKLISMASDKLISSLFGSLFNGVGSAAGSGGATGAVAAAGGSLFGGLFSGIGKLFGFANGGIMTSAGSLPLHRYATGGIANTPQLAMFGEGKSPEAYVPLPDGRSIPVNVKGGGGMGGGGSAPVVNHTQTNYITPANGVTAEQLASILKKQADQTNRQIGSTVANWQKRYG